MAVWRSYHPYLLKRVYPNDPGTQSEVDRLVRKYDRVHKVVTPLPGPTCKADCLNCIVGAILDFESIAPVTFAGYRPLFPADLIRHAQKARVVRDGPAGFFYHPDMGVDYLRQVVDGLRNLDYSFVAADSLPAETAATRPRHPARRARH